MDELSLTQTPKSGPKDVFMHLLSIVALYVSVVSFITLLFQYINVWYPDPLNYYYSQVLNIIRWSSSILVVMFPVYILMTWLIDREFKTEPARRGIKIRKWLIYLTLFISALTVIIDVITLVYNFMGGELTMKFFLKILVVLLSAAAVFGYYFWEMRLKETVNKKFKAMAWSVSVIVLAAIVGGFFVVGSPARQRQIKFDDRRTTDLQSIQSMIINYWQQKQALPPNLDALKDSISGFVAPVDPETGKAYEYNIKGNLNFELCANYNLDSVSQNSPYSKAEMPQSIYDPYSQNWTHGSGRVCFDRAIDPQLYQKSIPVK